MNLFVFIRNGWLPDTFCLVCAEDEQEARSLLEGDNYALCDVYEIEKGVIGDVVGG